jgi:hypothetical protein
VVVPGIAGWLGRANYERSINDGLTETFDEFCDRISQQPAAVGHINRTGLERP